MLQIGASRGAPGPKPKKRFAGESDVPEPVEMTGCLFSHQVFEHHLIERGIVAVSDELPRLFLVEAARFPEEMEKGAPAVFQVRQPMLDPGRTERVDVEANIFTVLAVPIAFDGADLVEGNAKVGAAEGLVLVKLQAVLVV